MSEQRVEFPAEFCLADYFLFDRIDEGLGDKTAVRFGDLDYSYAEVAERSRAFASYLQSLGVRPEERVYIVLPDVPAFAWAFFGTLASGAVVAMGNPAAPIEDLGYVLEYSRASVLVTTPEVARGLAASLELSPSTDNHHLRGILLVPHSSTGEDCEASLGVPVELAGRNTKCEALSEALRVGRDQSFQPVGVARDDVAIWLFTSGSTGRPKAAVHTHRDFAYNTEVYAKRTVGYRSDDITVSASKLFFGYATGTNLMFPFAVGATTCLFSERCTSQALMQAIEMYRPTIVTNVPTMMAKILQHDAERTARGDDPLDLSCIRFHLSAGEALPPALLERFVSRFASDVYDGIGSAEMFHIYASNRPGDIKPGSLGRVVDGYSIAVLPAEAEGPGEEPVPQGEIGVLWVKGDSVAQCYFQDRDKSWQTFHGYWCCTGDLFRIDGDGYLWFEGRADSLFKSGGIWVSPLEIENCLMEHDAVALAAVIPAEREGLAKPKAFVVLREPLVPEPLEGAISGDPSPGSVESMEQALQEHVRHGLSNHKYPRWVVFVDDLPKNDRGKVDRKALIASEQESNH